MTRPSVISLIALFCVFSITFSAPVDQETLGGWPSKDKISCDVDKIKADIVFIWDGSGALDETTSAIIYEYILAFLKPFKYGPDAVQAAMVVYERKVTQTIRFNEAKSFDEFKNLVDTRGPPQGNGDKAGIDDAFKVTLEQILTEKNGSRRNVPRLVVFFASQKATGPSPLARVALLRQQAELFVVSEDTHWKLSDEELLQLTGGDQSHIYQYNDVNVQDALPASLVLATWRAVCDAQVQTFFVSFIDESTDFSDELNDARTNKHKAKVQEYHDKLASVYQHSALHAAVIDVQNFEKTENNKTRVLTKTTFRDLTSALEEKGIQDATEYLAEEQKWRELKATRLSPKE